MNSIIRRTLGGFVAFTAVASYQPEAARASLILSAVQDQSAVSSFTFDFGAFGGARSAFITDTQYQLAIDPLAAPGQSASFNNYYQTVDSIDLPTPLGDVPTGELTITIEQSFGGTYDALTGAVTTNDLYRIDFTGDLSALGLTSPVYLPGESTGTVNFATASAGDITLNWEGIGDISGIQFNYTCATNANFTVVPEPASLAMMGLIALAAIRNRRRG